MILLCPHCGNRDHAEFNYRREATPAPAIDADEAAWFDYVYLRRNEKGAHRELWQHTAGCRAYFEVVRDTATNAMIAATALAETPATTVNNATQAVK